MTTKGVKVAQAKTALDNVLAVATRFKDYNVRSYLARRAKDAFASMDADKNETGATRFIEDFAEKEMKWMARQERVYEIGSCARVKCSFWPTAPPSHSLQLPHNSRQEPDN